MQEAPTRVIIVTEHYDPKSANAAFEATRAGALDLLGRPSWGDPCGPAATSFRDRLKDLADVPVIGQRRTPALGRPRERRTLRSQPECELVVLVASTGGPSVLATLLTRLGDDLDKMPILVVQHLLEGFDTALVCWLSELTKKPIRLGRDGDPIEPGALFAPDGRHMLVQARGRLGVSEQPVNARHRPSGDLLLESAARAYGASAVGVILTGMGDDGLVGARLLRALGGSVIVQHPDTCVVPGMPGAAIDGGVADAVMTPDEIAEELSSRIRRSA
jgi:two-component system chemotaxis response regulator CheB